MGRKVWTAAELEKMSPSEQDAIFRASIIRDLEEVPAEFLDKVRARIEERIEETETSGST